jgi:uncharacterized coiled-coil protein SlyX
MHDEADTHENNTGRQVEALAERVTELEIALTYQRQTTQTLDELIREAFDTIGRLKARIDALQSDLTAGEE